MVAASVRLRLSVVDPFARFDHRLRGSPHGASGPRVARYTTLVLPKTRSTTRESPSIRAEIDWSSSRSSVPTEGLSASIRRIVTTPPFACA